MKYLLVLLMLLPVYGRGQIITSIAGGGSSIADSVPASSAYIDYGGGIVVNKYGDIVIVQGNYNKVREIIMPSDIITTIAGTGVADSFGDGGPAASAALDYPVYIANDAKGNLYISDNENNKIRKIDSSGIITTIAGTGAPGFSGDSGLAVNALINRPICITCDDNGNIYFVDGVNIIRKIDTSGIINTIAGNGIEGFSGDGGAADSAQLNQPYGLCTDIHGNLYISDWGNNRIRKVDMSTGIISTIAGNGSPTYSEDDVPASSASINPIGLVFDFSGNLLIADLVNNRIREIDTSGIIHTVAGNGIGGFSGDGGAADSAELYQPEGIALDSCGNLYIADDMNHHIRKVTFHPADTPTLSITATQDTLCHPTPVTFTATAVNGGATPAYQWQVNGMNAGTDSSSYTYTPANGDTITCTLTSSDHCANPATATSNVIHEVVYTSATPTISIAGPAGAALGSTVHLTATVTGASSYFIEWRKNGIYFTTTTVPYTSYTKNTGIDNINAELYAASSTCPDSASSETIQIHEDEAVGNITVSHISIYPNPVHNELHITSGQSIGHVAIADVLGQVVYAADYDANNAVINTASLPLGVYILKINHAVLQKLIKE